MATTVDEGFRTLHQRLTPTDTETAAAKSHRASIKACLKNNFEITRFFRTGSFGNGTSVRNFSDVDYFASIPNRNLTADSDLTLRKIWRALDARFPQSEVGIKTWKYYKTVPLYSFYLEMQVARYASKESSIVYSIDVKNIFKLLKDGELAAMQDPVGISGYIYPAFSAAMKADALSKINRALTRAEKAREAEDAGRIKDAFYWWDMVFDGYFPAYG